MQVKINSNAVEIEHDLNLKKWLENSGYNLDLVAVECDGNIVKKGIWDKFVLENGMSLEIVEFVGGG